MVLENWLKELWSPVWPSDFPKPLVDRVAAGQVLFKKNCISCHEVIPHGKQNTPVKVVRTPVEEVGTDKKMAMNAIMRTVKSGRLKGSKLPGLDPLPAKLPAGSLVVNVARGAILSPFHDIETASLDLLSLKQRFLDLTDRIPDLSELEIQRLLDISDIRDDVNLGKVLDDFEEYNRKYAANLAEFSDSIKEKREANIDKEDNPNVYKARPLDGIWATAPYLHNGSVPNLYELLLPADQRTKKFHVGSINFDPVKIGFDTAPGPGTTEIDCSIEGNLNTGHDQYGTFTEKERLELVEYLKTL